MWSRSPACRAAPFQAACLRLPPHRALRHTEQRAACCPTASLLPSCASLRACPALPCPAPLPQAYWLDPLSYGLWGLTASQLGDVTDTSITVDPSQARS